MMPRPVLARRPVNPRSHENIIADAKNRYAEALAYLADRPFDIRRAQANQQSDAERDARGRLIEIEL
jgi:hypothetical protein